MTGSELVFMCADTGAVVCVGGGGAAARVLVFLPTGETFWATGAQVRPDAVRVSAMAALFTAPAHIVPGEPVTARQVPLSIALALEPAAVDLALAGDGPERVTVVHGSGSIAVGSVVYRVEGAGWLSTAAGPVAQRARAVFQDRSATFAAELGGAVMVNTELRRAPVADLAVRGQDRVPVYRLSCALGGRTPRLVTGEIRDTMQHVTFVEPAPDGAGWVWWSAAPFVFVRSGTTGLGLVERTTRADSPREPLAPAGDLPDPY
ncbi:hypothetical protein KZZ52_18385 [Dactylosporangium sp. AC04546]|uniref:hypothetical protein n=1 Tax=Dactylosporangium sp. AC04546 TaxID=2862460 RepID=UPI001EDE69F1|nr:hypothetical protein [Dactylosporangium sp. AC04546]WVK87271.1 hypothetical protein KZZ52_18385 [Dactylosporangium sp. AC04546]